MRKVGRNCTGKSAKIALGMAKQYFLKNNMDTKYIDLAKKLKALAERGEGGEMENAKTMLESIMRKYNITIDDITSEEKAIVWFKVNVRLKKLFNQVAYSIMGKGYGSWNRKLKRSLVGIECTRLQEAEIRNKFDFYSRAYKEELDAFLLAFVHANKLFPDDPDVINKRKLTPKEKARLLKALQMSESMSAKHYLNQLGDGK